MLRQIDVDFLLSTREKKKNLNGDGRRENQIKKNETDWAPGV